MSTEENKALVRGFVDQVLNRGNIAAIPDFFVGGTLLAGQIEGMTAGFRRGFPDLTYTITNMVAEDDMVALYTHWRGTNTGPRPSGPATGKEVESVAFWLFKIAVRAGSGPRIVSMASVTDRMAIMEQLRAAPEPDQAAA